MSNFTLKFNRTNSQAVIIDLVSKNEEGDKIIETCELDLGIVPADLANGENDPMSLAAYGLLKAVQDRNSSLSNKALSEMGLTGQDAMKARIEAYQATYDLFLAGNWKNPSTATRAGAAIDPIFAAAVAELKGCEITQATMALKAATKEERAAIRQLPAVKEIIDRMKAEAIESDEGTGIDLSDLI